MNKLEIYEKINACETLEELADIIMELADENGNIQGRTRKFNAAKMAKYCTDICDNTVNTLTREFGIRQQAIYILYYENDKVT